MAQITNLNRARKQRARDDKRKSGDEMAAKHGRTKAERLLEATQNQRAKSMLDQHEIDSDHDSEFDPN